ncbi:2Fe-2S iron-sulfur cluster binding domain-containing protein [Roseovarius nanhaiticus]|uniref:2Fe-2S iron-sulfur cluster binding domain-containing protein n=1 Tax=Roseovarius nanhaiticus TaxID=573024 RepID=A0A1N7G914_9RHOB|nr:(2Fe-2S)-binding protein [Roseovarius nanhaiticus]SEK33804.1 2Fe-2S iron-sulfur cluster binding domain-containing protein [Roseovarius nanhaiticus]SIS09061.1 2Fe-2S iron-sulfur cluster binding domain-containing protein [Roseovarius nanhaiticus]
MNVVSRFQAPPEAGARVSFDFEGTPVTAPAGASVAAALLAQSGAFTRQTASGAPRAPYCMMGVCFECLVEVDGRSNVQACLTPVREGMRVRRQIGLRGLAGEGAG